MRTATAAREIASRTLDHLLRRLAATAAEDRPFSHMYLEHALPPDVYRAVLEHLPDTSLYGTAAERHRDEGGGYVRTRFELTRDGLDRLPASTRELWRGIAAALTAPELKRAVFARLARDLAYRYGVAGSEVSELAGYSRPTLYRETEGFEIPPHPDTRKKVVTMHLYLPADLSQLGLGTALYRRRPLVPPVGDWRRRFAVARQFEFRPNSGYAFVVNNTLWKRSWHGRERLPEGAGVRNTLLNTFYAEPRDEFTGYLPDEPAGHAVPLRRAA